jgi:hypothetical protein
MGGQGQDTAFDWVVIGERFPKRQLRTPSGKETDCALTCGKHDGLTRPRSGRQVATLHRVPGTPVGAGAAGGRPRRLDPKAGGILLPRAVPRIRLRRISCRSTRHEVEAIGVHDLVPGGDEVVHEPPFAVVLGVDRGVRAQNRVRAEHEVDVRLTKRATTLV